MNQTKIQIQEIIANNPAIQENINCRRSFYYFFQRAWQVTESQDFIPGWYIELLCNAAQAVYEGKKIRKLAVNVSPQTCKTLIFNVMFPAWVLGRNPSEKILAASYSVEVGVDLNQKFIKLINSDWYKSIFPETVITTNQTGMTAFSKGGMKLATGVGGKMTGFSAGIIILDDLLKVEDQFSAPQREKVNRWFQQTVNTRFYNLKKAKIIVLGQRLHQMDIFGFINSLGLKYEKIILPMEFIGPLYSSKLGLNDPRTKIGEIMHPERYTPEILKELKVALGSYGYAGQYQQQPHPEGGTVFHKESFENRIDLPRDQVRYRFLSFDLSGTKTGHWSSCVVGELDTTYHLFIREVDRRKLEFPKLLEWINEMIHKYADRLDRIYCENASNGIPAIQSLKDSAEYWIALMIESVNPGTKDKVARGQSAAVWVEAGCILLPPENDPNYPWLLDFQSELFAFPGGTSDDMVDAFSQLVNKQIKNLAEGYNFRNRR